MAIYAIGDVQGCLSALQRLLEKIEFSAEHDTLWFAGDLVCRGQESLETLRFIKSLGSSAVVILGNHDISLFAAHYGVIKAHPTLKPILKADDRDDLIDWLRHKPLFHVDESLGWCMAHAGVYPLWEIEKARELAAEVEASLQGDKLKRWLKRIYGDKPKRWDDGLSSYARERFIVNAFTRMRGCKPNGALSFRVNGTVKEHREQGLIPWFDLPERKVLPFRLVFGHWAALDYQYNGQVLALDSGCVWGRKLTAVRLDSDIIQPIQVACK